jgi:hypothetical protein
MRVLKEAIARALSKGLALAQAYGRASKNRNGDDDAVLDHAEGVRQCIRRPAGTIVQSAPGHSVRRSRNTRGVQPCVCI